MIALILGGAPSVFDEAEEAARLLGRRHMVVAANLAGVEWRGRLDGWASLHSDLLPGWLKCRKEPGSNRVLSSPRLFTPDLTPERWPGSSGLYALQCALFDMGATGAVLCGVPMISEAGHFSVSGSWAGVADYRRAFEAALPEIGGRVRAMGGWTAELFGEPTTAWIDAIDITRPAGATASATARSDTMHHIKNGSAATLSFWHRQDDGLQARVHLAPGEGGQFEIDPNASEFARDGVSLTAPRAPAAPRAKAAPRTKTAAPKKRAARKPAAPAPQEPAPPAPPVSDEA